MIDSEALCYRSRDRESFLRLMAAVPQLTPMLAELLVGRGHCDPDSVHRFLSSDASALHDPSLLRNLDLAVSLLRQAMQDGRKVLVHGDYDCDGICATALLMDGLSELGVDVDYHIPDRFVEGYGLSMKAVERCREEGFGVLLSVDCGSSSHREIEAAKAAGICVIITDHHQVPDPAPEPHALVNPQHPLDNYPFKGLCGTGVAYKLLQALRGEKRDEPSHLLDLVALATIADVVPLVEENRVLVKLGLALMSQTQRPGLKALLEVTGHDLQQPVDAFQVAFGLAPRLNAAGRLEHARAGVELLRCGAWAEARQRAEELQALNEERKECEQKISNEIEERLQADPRRYSGGAIVEWGEGWHEGVIGITAGRLAEKYGVPALVIAVDGERAKGSGRSPENVDLFLAMKECEELFAKFGGHPRAGGFSLASERLEKLREDFTAAANRLRRGLAPVWIDGSLGLGQLSLGLVRGLQRLEPYGEANPRPVFLLEGVTVTGQRTVGKNHDHLQLELEQGGHRQRAIAFRQGREIDALDTQNSRYDMLCQLAVDSYRGEPSLRLQVTGIVRPKDETQEAAQTVVDRRNSRARRSELERWLEAHEFYIAICRDATKAAKAYPHLQERFWTYQGVDGPWDGMVLLTPPSSEQELAHAISLGQPQKIIVLFGRQELDEMNQAAEATFWNRDHATSVWRELRSYADRLGDLESTLGKLSSRLPLSRAVVGEILGAFLETGALYHESGATRLQLGQGSGIKLEETQVFQLMQERRHSHQRLLQLFTGPTLGRQLKERFPQLGESQLVAVSSGV